MKKAFFSIASFCVFFLGLPALGQLGGELYTLEWARTYESPGPGSVSWGAREVALDTCENVFVAGISNGVGTGKDFITIKYSPAGQELWRATYDGPAHGDDEVNGIAVDAASDVYVTGSSDGGESALDYQTIKYSGATGAVIWESRYAGPGIVYYGTTYKSDRAYDIAVDPSGDVVVTGFSHGPKPPSSFRGDCATIKYHASDGEMIWLNRYGESYFSDEGREIAFDPSGDIYIVGMANIGNFNYLTLKLNSAGGFEWARTYDSGYYEVGIGIAVDSTGVYVTGGSWAPPGTPEHDNYYDFQTFKYDLATGAEIWSDRYAAPGFVQEWGRNIAIDPDSNVIVSGTGATVKYSSGGDLIWATNVTGDDMDLGPSGNIVLVDFNSIKVMDGSGSVLWQDSRSGLKNSVHFGPSGNIYAAGYGYYDGYDRFDTIKYRPTFLSIRDVIAALPGSAFQPPPEQHRAALLNKLDEAFAKYEAGDFEGAINKLENDILAKLDGFFGGDPSNDWIVTEEAQRQLYPLVVNFVDYLKTRL